ncbi:MAG: hypothetical protein ABJN65_08990 [Parasphingorhabdus sp.]
MNQDERVDAEKGSVKLNVTDSMRYALAETICSQNRSRAQFIPNVQFGDPVWDLMLHLYTAEYFERSTTIASISARTETQSSVTIRCLNYLLEQEAVFENTNQFSKKTMPYLVSDETKATIGSWLDNCISNLQTGLSNAAFNAH